MAYPTPAVPSEPQAIQSPSLSTATSTSSYAMPSNLSPTNSSGSLRFTEGDSDDEIVWSVSEGSLSPGPSESDNASASGDDYVVLSWPGSVSAAVGAVNSGISTPSDEETLDAQTAATASLALEKATKGLSLATPESSPEKAKKEVKGEKVFQQHATASIKQRKRKAKKNKSIPTRPPTEAYPSPAPSPKTSKASQALLPVNGTRDWFEEMSLVKLIGLGARPIVDDYSDRQSIISCDNESVGPTLYEEASTFISRFLLNPEAKTDTICRLTLLQSLIIELGLATPSLPESLSAAKAFLKSRAFLNIKEYLAVREHGPEAVRGLLHPSKSALIKDIKKKRNRVSLKWVKEHGLQVLLVGWMH
ncbi:hypothetical protein CPB84DRAFT_1763318 [Gymnopilus junonius]|uniref:Uncharacterized protein n=1 Tax=Gymnopilus junonius TaxID=109634 RepID=A0A9P5NYS3_GYMJU|nr:hypothetical protein CPB84DRAFT_1763318 [Gymnopilus junonius]